MAWKSRGTNSVTGLTSWTNSDPFFSSYANDLAYDLRTWGFDVDAGGNKLLNLGGLDAIGMTVAGTAGNLSGVIPASLQNSSKLLIGWNASAGGGEISFVSNFHAGTDGGFKLYSYSDAGVLSLLAAFLANGNFGLASSSFGGGAKVLSLAYATAPGSNPVSAGILYVDGADGKLKFRGSSGTVTQIALP